MQYEYKEVDKEGFVIETHLLDEDAESQLDLHKSWGTDYSFYIPRWDNELEEWVEAGNVPDPLVEAKSIKIQELEEDCIEAILGRFKATVDLVEYSFSYDSTSQKNLMERWQLFQTGLVDTFKVTAQSEDGSTARLTVDVTQFEIIYLASIQHKENQISKLHDSLIPLVNEAISFEEIEAITWSDIANEPIEDSVAFRDPETRAYEGIQVDLLEDSLMELALMMYE